jgi:putative Mg2+ transporter-C (MgtC) family protein
MLDEAELALRLGVALLLGSSIGFERQHRHRVAGLRTNALVSVGSASFTAVSLMVEGDTSPTRVAAQVVSGIGFLGAGVILRQGIDVRGLTTAATLWCAAAVGVAAGAGFFVAALLTTVAIVAVNVALRPVVRKMERRGGRRRPPGEDSPDAR